MDDLVDEPTPENAHAASRAVARLQRAYDHVLRRLDGDGDLPEFPVHRHDPTDTAEDCARAVLDELAGTDLPDRAETLAHGLEAVQALTRQLAALRTAAAEAHHWQNQFHSLERLHSREVSELQRHLSDARSWAWAEVHRHWDQGWFPASWTPQTTNDDWHLPEWLATGRPPHEQSWWTPPRPVLHVDLNTLDITRDSTGAETATLQWPLMRTDARAESLDVGDLVYLTDGTRYLAAEITGRHEHALTVSLRRRPGDA